MPRKVSWTPRRRGNTYCSSACGHGCTWDEFQDAHRKAKELCERLKGSGWKPLVFENMGWHWRAVSASIVVYPAHEEGKFWCMIDNRIPPVGGAGLWTGKHREFKDPNRAVREAMKVVGETMLRLNQVYGRARNAAGL
jgi:hypothetical protein